MKYADGREGVGWDFDPKSDVYPTREWKHGLHETMTLLTSDSCLQPACYHADDFCFHADLRLVSCGP